MVKVKILVVEDDKDLSRLLRFNFKKEGFDFLIAKSGEDGLRMALKHKPDLIISDIGLPKMDGIEMVRALRQKSQVPVIFLTAKREEVDRILGFELGADDYLAKPFSIRELICRVKAVLRRAGGRAGARRPSARVGAIEVDFGRHEVKVNGKSARLAPREFELLALLIEANGNVVSREQLLKQIWGIDACMEIQTRTVDQHVARMRRSLRSEGRRIVTIPSFGYRIKDD